MELYDLKLEQVILGTAMVLPKYLADVETMLKPEYFYSPFHKDVVNCIHKLIKDRKNVDILSVSHNIENKTDKTIIQVSDLTNFGLVGGIEQKIHFIAELYFKRRLAELSLVCHTEIQSGKDMFEMKDYLSKGLLEIQQEIEGIKGEKLFSKSVDKTIQDIILASETPDHISGIPTGSRLLDAITGGWQNSDLIILAARPGMGKTARALQFTKAAINSGKNVLFFSLEMSIDQLIQRLLAEGAGIDLTDLRRGRLSHYSLEQVKTIAEQLKTLPIVVNDNGRSTIYDIAAKARILKSQNKLDFLVVDYLQIIKGSKSDKSMPMNYLIGMFTSEFKAIAKECNIPVMVLAQLNRGKEDSANKRPEIQNLKDSGNIEQDADFVGLLYRPSYYTKGNQEQEEDADFKQLPNDEYLAYSEFIIAKHRHGSPTAIIEYFNGKHQRFTDNFRQDLNGMPYEEFNELKPFWVND